VRTFYFVLMVVLAFLAAVVLPLALTGQIQLPHH
jgi:uncharacterized membrane protein YozB (DUF420 family)